MEATIKVDIVIIGAGPTGLSLACQLVRHGIDFVIIEKNERVTPYSKAIGVHARTLEIYEQIGLAQKAVEQGAIAGRARMLAGGEVRGEFDLSTIGLNLSPYPFMLVLEQSKNEQLLYEYLQSQGNEVLWQSELGSFSQTQAGVTASVKTPEGRTQTIEAKFLVGCDGPRSLTRRTLGLEFQGSTFERMFYVADAQVDWKLSHDALHICLARDSFLLFFPLRGQKRYRIVGVFPEELSKDESDILYEEIEQQIKKEAELELDVHDVEWFSTYKVHTRHVNKFSEGRCFLAGDAAHIHSPAGAQGMNTGIQDGYNLAWKLAFVLKGAADKKLLETYNEERLENAKNLLQTTDRLFELGAGSDWFLAFLRIHVVPRLANYVLSLETVKNFLFPLVSQIGINYRHSSLSDHAGGEDFKVRAGDRMPYFLVNGKSIYEKLHQPKFHLLVFSDAAGQVPELECSLAALVDLKVIQLDSQVTEVFGATTAFSVLLRPDNYIGSISHTTSAAGLSNYLKKFAMLIN